MTRVTFTIELELELDEPTLETVEAWLSYCQFAGRMSMRPLEAGR